MKKFLSLLLTLCLLLGILPSQALAYVGDILPSTGSTVTTEHGPMEHSSCKMTISA